MELEPRTGERLDLYLVRKHAAVSRRTARELISTGSVRVNGRIPAKGLALAADDLVEVNVEADWCSRSIVPNPELRLEVLYQDDAAIVVNKPAPMACCPLRATEDVTVMNGVVARFPEIAGAGDKLLEGGLVHRLDNGTSGALLVARNSAAFKALRRAIKSGAIRRRYEALVSGSLPMRLELQAKIAHHPKNRARMVAAEDAVQAQRLKARPAATKVEPLAKFGAFTLASVFTASGSRHQIRVHLAHAGFPIVGDELYGGATFAAFSPQRFWLHLREMEFESPSAGIVTVAAPLPTDLNESIAKLGYTAGNRENNAWGEEKICR